jgi:hypothetical protein
LHCGKIYAAATMKNVKNERVSGHFAGTERIRVISLVSFFSLLTLLLGMPASISYAAHATINLTPEEKQWL